LPSGKKTRFGLRLARRILLRGSMIFLIFAAGGESSELHTAACLSGTGLGLATAASAAARSRSASSSWRASCCATRRERLCAAASVVLRRAKVFFCRPGEERAEGLAVESLSLDRSWGPKL
jgi:hypothetical protein